MRMTLGEKEPTQIDEEYNFSKELFQLMSEGTSTYSMDEKLTCVMQFLSSGNLSEVARQREIPYMTIVSWKNSKWWPLALQMCHKKKDKELELIFSGVIHSVVGEIADRVADGEWKAKKDGELYRVPMKARDLSFTLGMLYDRRAAIRGEHSTLSAGSTSTTSDKLKALEGKFNEFADQLKAKTIEAEVVYES